MVHAVDTVSCRGGSGLKNGELLAQSPGIDLPGGSSRDSRPRAAIWDHVARARLLFD